jgi:hypothetical protein
MNDILDQTLALHSFRTGQAAGPKTEASPKVESYRYGAEAVGAPAGTPLRGDVKSAPEPSDAADAKAPAVGTPVPAYMRAPEQSATEGAQPSPTTAHDKHDPDSAVHPADVHIEDDDPAVAPGRYCVLTCVGPHGSPLQG